MGAAMTPEERADRAANLWMAAARTQSGTRYDKRIFIANEIRAAIAEEREAIARWYETEYDPDGRDAPRVARMIRERS